MNVLVIPEEFTKDQYVLKPIMAALMEKLGKPQVTIEVCRDPRLRGIQDALDWDTIQGIIDRYSYRVDLFLLCVDRDGEATHRARLDHLEAQSGAMLRPGQRLLGENAWQEVEVQSVDTGERLSIRRMGCRRSRRCWKAPSRCGRALSLVQYQRK